MKQLFSAVAAVVCAFFSSGNAFAHVPVSSGAQSSEVTLKKAVTLDQLVSNLKAETSVPTHLRGSIL